VFASEGVWANVQHEEVAQAQAAATGVDIEAIRRFVERSNYGFVPGGRGIVKVQQSIADRFARLGLIPKPVLVVAAARCRTRQLDGASKRFRGAWMTTLECPDPPNFFQGVRARLNARPFPLPIAGAGIDCHDAGRTIRSRIVSSIH